MNALLSAEHIENPDFAKAAAELLQNAELMIVAGCFEQAHAALDRLLRPGPWKVPDHSRAAQQVEALLPMVCHLVGRPMPAFRNREALSLDALAARARSMARTALSRVGMPSGPKPGATGESWSEAYLQGLPDIADAHARNKAFQAFCLEAEVVLNSRANEAGAPPLVPDSSGSASFLMQLATMFGADNPLRPNIAEAAKCIPTGAIARATAAYLHQTGTAPDHNTNAILFAAMALSLRDGNSEDAAFCVGELMQNEAGRSVSIHATWWQPLADFFREGRGAGAIGITDAAADQYLAALNRRPAAPAGAERAPAATGAGASSAPASETRKQPAKNAAALSTEYLEHPKLDKAVTELVQNARRLILAGCFEQAHAALDLLFQPGPWKVSLRSAIASDLEFTFPVACFLAGKPFPKIGDTPAMSVSELAAWAKSDADQMLKDMGTQGIGRPKNAGDNWSMAYLQGLPAIEDARARRIATHAFYKDALCILTDRFGIKEPDPLADIGSALAMLGEDKSPETGLLLQLFNDAMAPTKIGAAASEISNDVIVQTILSCVSKEGSAHPEAIAALKAATILNLKEGRQPQAANIASELTRLLTSDRDAFYDYPLMGFVRFALWPPVAALFRNGHCAQAAGIDAASADQYLRVLQKRPAPSGVQGSTPTGAPAIARPDAVPAQQPPKPCTQDALRAALAATPLAGRALIELPILDTSERAYAMAVNPREMEAMWKAARALVETTHRWPVLTTQWGGDSSATLEENLLEEDPFTRYGYEDASDADDVSPRAILAAADSADVAKFLQRRMRENEEYSPLGDAMDSELDATGWACQAGPTPDEVAHARLNGKPISTYYQLDRWLLDWERKQGASIKLDEVRQEWFDPENAVLLFLPTPNPWDTLAYLYFWDSSIDGVENVIALGRRWQQRWGAELMAHWGTMLQCYATRPPATDEDAWQLAVEQDIAARDTLSRSGISLR